MLAFIGLVVLAALLTSTESAPKGHLQPFGSWKKGVPLEELDHIPEPEEFYWRYGRSEDDRGSPVVLRGAARSMKAMQWTDALLLEKYGSQPITGVEYDLKETRTGGNVDGMNVMSDFLNAYNTSDIYMVTEVPPKMKRDVNFLPCMRCGGFHEFLNTNKVWMGRGGSKSVIHNDDQSNINCLFAGSKRFVLMHPSYRDQFEANPNTEMNEFGYVDVDLDDSMPGYGKYFRVDIDKMDLIKYPGWSKVDWFYTEVRPGDCIFIPPLWYHQVTAAPGRSINAHVWFYIFFDYDQTNCMSSVEQKPLSFADCTWGWRPTGTEEKQIRPTRCRKRRQKKPGDPKSSVSGEL